MTYHFLETPSPEQAAERYRLAEAPTAFDRIGAVAFHDPASRGLVMGQVSFTHQALAMLHSLNWFDLTMVLRDIAYLAEYPNQPFARRNKFNYWQALWRSRYPFDRYHYHIEYLRDSSNSGAIVIEDVFIDRNVLGVFSDFCLERNALHRIEAVGDRMKSGDPDIKRSAYPGVKSLEEAQTLKDQWRQAGPVTEVTTHFAAVNGMLNDLNKATWLMGEHLKVAYPDAPIDVYTLFHNPTEGGMRDLAECLWDKFRMLTPASVQAMHLAAILRQQQELGRRTDWVAHSQGAIIFMAAVHHHLAFCPGMRLDRHRVALHAGGSVGNDHNKSMLSKVGIEMLPERICPFDLVPNTAGRHDLSLRGLLRAVLFAKGVISENGGNPAVSPHTLPYLGICTYYLQLKESGFHARALCVRAYMHGMSERRIAYERTLNDPNGDRFQLKTRSETVMDATKALLQKYGENSMHQLWS